MFIIDSKFEFMMYCVLGILICIIWMNEVMVVIISVVEIRFVGVDFNRLFFI